MNARRAIDAPQALTDIRTAANVTEPTAAHVRRLGRTITEVVAQVAAPYSDHEVRTVVGVAKDAAYARGKQARIVRDSVDLSEQVSEFYGRTRALELVGALAAGDLLLDEFTEEIDGLLAESRNPAWREAFVRTLDSLSPLLAGPR